MNEENNILSMEDIKIIFSEQIRQIKSMCNKNKYNITCSKHLLSYLKEYSNILIKEKALEENIKPSELDFKKMPPIVIGVSPLKTK